jgi:DNA-directed RNA polymerase subunit K/omega
MDSEEEIVEQLDADIEESDVDASSAQGEEEEDLEPAAIPDEIIAEELVFIVPESNWQTPDLLSRYEMTRLISLRAAEIEANPNCCLVEFTSDDPVELAKAELAARRCPLMVRRQVGKKIVKINGKEVAEIYVECRDPNAMAHAEIL